MSEVNTEVLNIYIRYLINAAQKKRLIPYHELENIFGFNHANCGIYSGKTGEFCMSQNWPLLNSLVVKADSAQPSYGYDDWKDERDLNKIDWKQEAFKCWSYFHVTSSREKQSQNFSGLNNEVRRWCKGLSE